jgi:hypothetical protein
MIIGLIFLTIAVVFLAYYVWKLNNITERGFAEFAIRNDNAEVIKAIESIDVKVDFGDVIKTVEGGTNEILVKLDNQTETITEKMENLTFYVE